MKTRLNVLACALLVLSAAMATPATATAGLIAQYHFDESSGVTAFDSFGSFDGTLSATGASFVAGGISGNAIRLDETSGGLVDMGTSFPGFLTGDFSIVLWVKTTDSANDSIVLSKHNAGFNNGYLMATGATGGGGAAGKATFYASESPIASPVSTTGIADDVWHQIVGVYRAAGTHSVYVDGAPAESSTPSSSMIANTSAFVVGGYSQTAGNGTPVATFTGLVDEIQVYNQSLTDSQINFLFANPSQAVPEPNVLALLVAGLLGCRRKRCQGPF